MVVTNLKSLLEDVLAPLIELDGGKLFWVENSERAVFIHLGGKFAGCPGNFLVEIAVIQPLLDQISPKIPLTVTSGPILPSGAVRISATVLNN